MDVRLAVAAAVVALSVTACIPQDQAADFDGTWVGMITTEGNVTTVVNESGSVWGGTARLVEEASIGVDVGDDEYMLGYVHGIYATDDEIFVLDSQVPVLRVYDYDGRHLRDIGGRGEGPGEFTYPAWLMGTPDGRLFVQDNGGGRLNVYALDGEILDTIPLGAVHCCVHPTIVTAEGVPYVPVRRGDDLHTATIGLQAFGPEGPVGPLLIPPGSGYQPIRASAGDRDVYVHFAPYHTWAAAPWGAIVGGVSDRYRFEIRGFDGDRVVVEKVYEPIAVDSAERDWWRRYAVVSTRRRQPGWAWDGAEIPDVKPAFAAFVPTHDERVWVIREGPGHKAAECLEDLTVANVAEAVERPCWPTSRIIDVFSVAGRYLGAVEPPPGDLWLISQGLFVRGRTVLVWVTDEAGVHQVKRYRLVLSGEE